MLSALKGLGSEMVERAQNIKTEPPRPRGGPAGEADRWRHEASIIDADPAFADLEFLASILDDRFRIPGTNIRFGLDPLLGLVPGVGDTISGLLSSYLIWRAHKLGVSKFTLLRMAGNTLFDTVVGSVPVIGDIFDVSFHANRRNLELLRRYMLKEQRI
jgi:Domain of unknown function (DUF4112)